MKIPPFFPFCCFSFCNFSLWSFSLRFFFLLSSQGWGFKGWVSRVAVAREMVARGGFYRGDFGEEASREGFEGLMKIPPLLFPFRCFSLCSLHLKFLVLILHFN